MLFRTGTLILALLIVGGVPAEAAKRTVHLYKQPYAFDFSKDYIFARRINKDQGARETVSFEKQNKGIVVSGNPYDPATASPLITQEAYLAQATADKSTNVKYVNNLSADGRTGSYLIGSCMQTTCFYKMARELDQKMWMNVLVVCDACSEGDVTEVGTLADTLYQQVQKF